MNPESAPSQDLEAAPGPGVPPGSRAVVVTVSDGVMAGTREDASGDVVEARLVALGFAVERRVAADQPDDISRAGRRRGGW